MSNGPGVNSHVPEIRLKENGDIEVDVLVSGLSAGINAEISGYITQPGGVIIPFWEIKPIQADPETLKVGIERTNLSDTNDIRVVTRVSQLWPTDLSKAAQPKPGFKTTWSAPPPPAGVGWGPLPPGSSWKPSTPPADTGSSTT